LPAAITKNQVPFSDLTGTLLCRGGVYPQPQTSVITAMGGDKSRPYAENQAFKLYTRLF
jgi:hypothetical protein